jgi:chromosome segregation ATPase
MRFFGKSKGGNVSNENSADLEKLQRERDKHQAALTAAQAEIDRIEGETRARREKEEAKRAELASLEKKLATCGDIISWYQRKIADLKNVAREQVNFASEGRSEAAMNLKGTLAEAAEYQLALAAFAEFESSLPARIKELADSL